MNYNFNSQFPFPWSLGNPFIGNPSIQPSITPSASQTAFSLPQPPAQMNQVFNCTGILQGPAGVRFRTGVFPYDINNGSYPTTNSFPSNWNFSYNTIQSHPDPQTHVQTPPSSVQQTVQPAQVPPNVPQLQNAMGPDITGNAQSVTNAAVSDEIVAKVSTLLSDPKILESALSKLKKVSSSAVKNDKVIDSSAVNLSGTDNTESSMTKYDESDCESEGSLDRDAETTITESEVQQVMANSVNKVR